MNFVLIVLLHVYSGGAVYMHDFTSREKCELAASSIMSKKSWGSGLEAAWCVPR